VRTLIPLVCAAWLVALCPCWAGEQDRRFLEFPNDKATTTFDLSTVQVIQPGRFSIIATTIDNPDVIRLRLKALDTLQTYCSRPYGEYPFPADLLTLGPADMPIKRIEVRKYSDFTGKLVMWYYPYKRLAMSTSSESEEGIDSVDCFADSKAQNQWFRDRLAVITNGSHMTEVFDCRRGLMGVMSAADPSKAITGTVKPGTFGEDYYLRVCATVMHEKPYLPQRPGENQPTAPPAHK
jgi:hypothetical protein